jgi:excisionase family DNA binding protein
MVQRARTNAGGLEIELELAIGIVEAARRTGVSRSSIYDAIGRGDLKVRKAGRRSLILVDDLKAWVCSLPEGKRTRDAA